MVSITQCKHNLSLLTRKLLRASLTRRIWQSCCVSHIISGVQTDLEEAAEVVQGTLRPEETPGQDRADLFTHSVEMGDEAVRHLRKKEQSLHLINLVDGWLCRLANIKSRIRDKDEDVRLEEKQRLNSIYSISSSSQSVTVHQKTF